MKKGLLEKKIIIKEVEDKKYSIGGYCTGMTIGYVMSKIYPEIHTEDGRRVVRTIVG